MRGALYFSRAPRPGRCEADLSARQAGCRTCCCGGPACQRGRRARRGCQRCGKECSNGPCICCGRRLGVCIDAGCRRDCSPDALHALACVLEVPSQGGAPALGVSGAMCLGEYRELQGSCEVHWGMLRAQVKGPRDRLSEQQRAWLAALAAAGLQVEVLKVRASRKQEVGGLSEAAADQQDWPGFGN